MSSRGGIQTGSGRKLLSPRSRLVSKEKKKKTKKRWGTSIVVKQSSDRERGNLTRKRESGEKMKHFLGLLSEVKQNTSK